MPTTAAQLCCPTESGYTCQDLFRNPLADPLVMGASSGAVWEQPWPSF
ncbi:MAG: iron chelate uptake ABC transporter family permease subunit [Anaerolineae bacterium]|nr:iron chelate uptake ABC transporter family permease subunit [Anaerolineae bacterium]